MAVGGLSVALVVGPGVYGFDFLAGALVTIVGAFAFILGIVLCVVGMITTREMRKRARVQLRRTFD